MRAKGIHSAKTAEKEIYATKVNSPVTIPVCIMEIWVYELIKDMNIQ